MGFRTHRDIVGESYSGVAGTTALYRPYPSLNGALRAGYCFGTGYAAHAPEARGRQLGSRYDWSGNAQHIARYGRWTEAEYWLVCQVSSQVPRTPFALDTLLGSSPEEGVTIVGFCYSDATAKPMWIARSLGAPDGSNSDLSSTADPYIALTLQPQTASGSIRAGASVSNNLVQSTLSSLTDELGEVAMYAGTYLTSARNSFARGPGVSLKTGTPNSDSRTLGSTGRFIMGAETSTGTGENRLLGVAYYRGVLDSDDFNEIHSRYADFHTAIGSGLTIT